MYPYLSVVIPFRNDNYSPNAIKKFNLSLNILIDQFNKANLDTEIIVVDWNSPNPDKPLINEINVKKISKNVSLFVYEIDHTIHSNYKGHKLRNIVTEVACNVGIKRSRGKFVVTKMGDTFYSSKLIEFLSQKKLRNDETYRLDRVEVEINFPPPFNWEEHFNGNIITRKSTCLNSIHDKACGDFLLMSKDIWFSIKGIPESKSVTNHGADGEALHAAIGTGAKQIYLKDKICIYKIRHSRMYKISTTEKKKLGIIKKFFFRNNKMNILILITKFLFGIFNYPSTRLYNVKTRSAYRYYLVANFRRFCFGGNFLKKNNWGLSGLNLKKKYILHAVWDK